jgi:phosphoribosylformylglycinamidine synthase
VGFDVRLDGGQGGLFSEDPSRAVVCVAPAHVAELHARAAASGVPVTRLGTGGGDRLVVHGLVDVPLAEASAAFTGALPAQLLLTDI